MCIAYPHHLNSITYAEGVVYAICMDYLNVRCCVTTCNVLARFSAWIMTAGGITETPPSRTIPLRPCPHTADCLQSHSIAQSQQLTPLPPFCNIHLLRTVPRRSPTYARCDCYTMPRLCPILFYGAISSRSQKNQSNKVCENEKTKKKSLVRTKYIASSFHIIQR